jgi:hypothetical protein
MQSQFITLISNHKYTQLQLSGLVHLYENNK